MLTRIITRTLQTRIPILGSETRCARHYLACLVTLVLGLRLRLAPRTHYFVMLLKLVGSVYRRWEVCPQFSPYVFYQSHNLVCLISDFRKLRVHILVLGIAHQCILATFAVRTHGTVSYPYYSRASFYSTAFVPVLYFSTAIRQSDYTYQGQCLFIGSYDLEKLLRSVNKSNLLWCGRITYMSYLPTCNQVLQYLHVVRYCLLGIVWTHYITNIWSCSSRSLMAQILDGYNR